jgi:hypothetical protein
MSSKTKKTEAIRNRKKSPNKANMKEDQKRLIKNLEVLAKAAKE